jgi:riboflavin synthase alpha subunit
MEEALLTIDALLEGHILPGHEDITGSVDKLLDKVANAKEKMATLRQYYGTN